MLLTLLAIVWVLIWVLALFDILRRRDLATTSKVLSAPGGVLRPRGRAYRLRRSRARPTPRNTHRRTATRFRAMLRMRAPATATRSDLAHDEAPR